MSTASKPKEPPLTRNEKLMEFGIGFLGWWVVNVGAWLFVTQGTLRGFGAESSFATYFNLFMLPANLVALLILAVVRRYVALGVLATYAVNLVIAMSIGLSLNGYCWFPFLVRLN